MNPDEKIRYVRVTNGLDIELVDRYDGVPCKIPPGKHQDLPPEMAAHFFGWSPDAGKPEMLRHTAKRHGWNTPDFVKADPETGKTKAQAYFDKLRIEAVVYKLVPAEPGDPQTPIPADPEPVEQQAPAVEMVKGPFGRMVPKRVEVNP